MTSTIFSLLLSLVPFTLIFIYMRMMRKREFVSFDINTGTRCYSCKEEIERDYFNTLVKGLKDDEKLHKLCKSCERDKSIDILFSKKRGQFILSLKKFILSEKYRKIQQRVTIGCVVLPLLGLLLKHVFGLNNHFTDISNIINIMIWCFMIFQLKTTTIPKK